ncbi:MAG: Lrp/AsnC family transcriptional regulator [Gammaproteobacteria bacterium]|nr:MAG: Lrp/AsnC family transcriptional regulator [Gammaproteobacteria bacterium]
MHRLARPLIDQYQRDMPLSLTPWADMAHELGVTETEVMQALDSMLDEGLITRAGPVFNHHKAGASTLVALAIAPSRVAEAVTWLNAQPGINHNYEREHFFNLWCVATASDAESLTRVTDQIRARFPEAPMLDLPMDAQYHIDLAFPIDWDPQTEAQPC